MRLSTSHLCLVAGATAVAASLASSSGDPPMGASLEGVAMPAHAWTTVAGKFWQISLPAVDAEDTSVTDQVEGTGGSCPPGLVEVRGTMKLDAAHGTVEALQDGTCTNWISREFPERCATFDADAWRRIARDLPSRPMAFCIDRFEYPDRKGEYPVVAVTWREAGAACEAQGKRLCTEDEWTFACEGAEALPYPYGYARDHDACVIDRRWRPFDEKVLASRESVLAETELDAAWQGEPSGARPRCRSPFGVYDMTGNVDEWSRSVLHEGFASVLKGGYWGPVRARCRASTRAHNEDFYFYQQGFRCCADAPGVAIEKDRDASPE